FRNAHLTGVPVMRPLVMEYPDDPNVLNLFDQFLVGEHLLVAPITLPSTYHRVVYLPKGIWYDYWTNKKYE
ncbi:glycoside hydrolase family 31 protein, partial [Faecalibacterium prausnitzii]|uniref:glycoside hydrolase family 31 protein n=2 Tax=Bacillota TaxID=1239 RepID=UPI00210AE1BA